MKTIRYFMRLMPIIFVMIEAHTNAQSFTWGGSATFTSTQQAYYDSYGSALLTDNDPAAPSFNIGYFESGFTPTLQNIGLWNIKFTTLASDQLSSTIPWNFGGTANVLSSVSDSLHPYLFAYDVPGQTGELGGKVFLGTWQNQTLPTFGSSDPPATFDFTDMTDVIAGAVDTNFPTHGTGGVISGTGYITLNLTASIQNPMADNSFEAQFARISSASVPEPSGAVLILTALGIATQIRRRHRTS